MATYKNPQLLFVFALIVLFLAACGQTAQPQRNVPPATATVQQTAVSPTPTAASQIITGKGTVEIVASFYLGDEGEILREEYFKGYTADLTEHFPQNSIGQLDEMEFPTNTIDFPNGIEVVEALCSSSCFRIYSTNGDPERLRNAYQNITFVLRLEDGQYVEFRMSRAPGLGVCEVRGARFTGQNSFEVVVKERDNSFVAYPYLFPASVLNEDAVLEIALTPGVPRIVDVEAEGNSFESITINMTTMWGVATRREDNRVTVYTDDYTEIAQFYLCQEETQ